ncbi:MAG: hypothetical protein WCF85_09735 [Rhodospirillaceae bacterium]
MIPIQMNNRSGFRQSNRVLVAAALICGAILVGGSVPALADDAPAAPEAVPQPVERSISVIGVVRPRDLMSPTERQIYRQAMRRTPDEAARGRLRAELIEKLSRRALERSTLMVIDTRLFRPGTEFSGEAGRRDCCGRMEMLFRGLPPRAP